MVKVGHFCVAAAAAADVCTAFVAPVGPAAAGLAASSQHARVLVSARSQSSDTFRHRERESSSRGGPSRRRQQRGLQVRGGN